MDATKNQTLLTHVYLTTHLLHLKCRESHVYRIEINYHKAV